MKAMNTCPLKLSRNNETILRLHGGSQTFHIELVRFNLPSRYYQKLEHHEGQIDCRWLISTCPAKIPDTLRWHESPNRLVLEFLKTFRACVLLQWQIAYK